MLAACLMAALVPPRASVAAGVAESASSSRAALAAFDGFVAGHGGAAVLGEPLGPVSGDSGSGERLYRYYRNFKLEYWPEHAGTPYEVQPALLGTEALSGRWIPPIAPFESKDNVAFFPETGHSVRTGFLRFFLATGGIELLGFPISEESSEGRVTTQYFQRGALAFDPAANPNVQALPLGAELAERMASPWRAEVTAADPPSLLAPGSLLRLRVNVKNSGSAFWPSEGPNRVTLAFHWNSRVALPDPHNGGMVALIRPLAPGDSATVEVPIQLPDRLGRFELVWDPKTGGEWFSRVGRASGLTSLTVGLPVPEMRVGILELGDDNPDDHQATISATASFRIDTVSGRRIADLPAETRVVVKYEEGGYHLAVPGADPMVLGEPLAFTTEPNALMIVDELQPGSAYRGRLEFRYSPELESAWVINTVSLNDYLAGLDEQGEEAPWEALKASVIAFQSYALAVRERMRNKGMEPFDLAASTWHTPSYFTRHQFYVGYRREMKGDRLRKAIEETRGMVVEYAGKPIEAVYFSQANGRTYSWASVWGGPGRPWSEGVSDPVSLGQVQVGHGVGMPLRSANELARRGFSAELILLHYYTGVELGFAY